MRLLDGLEVKLVDDLILEVDRAVMHVSHETRTSCPDHRVVEAAWTLPHNMLIRDDRRKWVLREILVRNISPELTERPRAGFGVPLAAWLRGPLRPWAEGLLSASALDDHGLLETAAVRRLWEEHIQVRVDRSKELWPVLMFQGWVAGSPTSSPEATPRAAAR